MFAHAFHTAASRAAILAAVGLAGCAPTVPPVAAVHGDTAFKARIAQAYPPGSRADRLRERLLRDGFVLLDDPVRRLHSAIWKDGNLPCYSETRIDWSEDRRGRIVLVQAARHDCT